MHVDEFNTDALVCQFLFGFNSLPHHVTTSNDRHIFSFSHAISLSNRERTTSSEYRPVRTTEAQVHRTNMISQCYRSCLCLRMICRNDHSHTRQHLHHTDILKYLVSCTIFTQSKTGMRCADLYILS